MAEKLIRPEGSWVALVTPFDGNGNVDFDCFRRLVDFQAANGTDGLLFMGSTGEAPSLTMEERRDIITEMTAYCRGKIPAFHGVTCPTTEATVELARHADSLGADGVMMVVPPYIAPPQSGVFEYFKTVCKSIGIAVALYNNPARVIVNINPETVVRLFQECPNLVADKEAVPNVAQLSAVMDGTGGKLKLLCCDAPEYAITLPTLAMGGHGTANVSGNVIPKEMAQMSKPWNRWEDVLRSRKLYFENLPVMEAAYSETNPVAIKAMVKLLGFPVGDPRPPLPGLGAKQMQSIEELINRLELRARYRLQRGRFP
ncbi:MAG: 4-hydroxy-tetrahydrodipicolinate synthase [Deltaproteobacteria bacterium]|nr:4-hydroxy-tetrahydrodipicolinate synthase [Deltaproteobacteria bacterium]